MNHELLRIIAERGDFTLREADKKMLDFFVEYLDHSSLFLLKFIPSADPEFVFTNEAQHFHFRLSEIREHYQNMKSGKPLRWEEIPFEYVSKE